MILLRSIARSCRLAIEAVAMQLGSGVDGLVTDGQNLLLLSNRGKSFDAIEGVMQASDGNVTREGLLRR
jgi:hypothetical protein